MASTDRFKNLRLDASLYELFKSGIRVNNLVRSSQGTYFGYLVEAKHDSLGQCVVMLVPSVVLPTIRDVNGKEFLPLGEHS